MCAQNETVVELDTKIIAVAAVHSDDMYTTLNSLAILLSNINKVHYFVLQYKIFRKHFKRYNKKKKMK